ncbi:TPA: hypothetical protein SMM67_001995 [Proteus mirabilis]|nr:hypothetical protein [Proteus mirabilis]
MFNKKELKDILLKKIIFPDFSNKITRLVIGVGITIILAPIPLKVVLYNWLIKTFNLNSGEMLKLSDFQSGSTDYIWGFSLIALALIHNIAYKIYCYQVDKPKREMQEIDVDRKLFSKFINMLPADSCTIHLLKYHDFNNSFDGSKIEGLQDIIRLFSNVENKFLDKDLEATKTKFINNLNGFYNKVGIYAAPAGVKAKLFSCIPDMYKGVFDIPESIVKSIDELNSSSNTCYQQYEEFVKQARTKLKC